MKPTSASTSTTESAASASPGPVGKQAAATPIAIVGVSGIFPDAPDAEAFWSLIRSGKDAIRDVPPTHWAAADYLDPDPKRPDHTYCARGGFLGPVSFDPTEFGIPPNALEATDTSQLLSLVVAKRLMRDAGYGDEGSFDKERVGVILGVTGTQELVISLGARLGHPIWRRALDQAGIPAAEADTIVQAISDGYVGWQENSFPGLLGNVVAGRIASRLDFGGTNCVVDAACASSLSAMHLSILELASGRADMMVTGGVDTLNDIFMYMCFSKTPALSPTGDVRPFSDDADGTVLGEGIGMVLLKRLDDATRDGDTIYAVIRGLGTSSDGRSRSIYAPRAEGQERTLRRAFADAAISPQDLDLVEAHGTGTKVGDATEFAALKEVFSEASDTKGWCALGSVKSQIGHTKAAAGAASVIKTALALHHKVLPPTAKIAAPNPKMGIEDSPFYLNTAPRPWLKHGQPRKAGVSSFGFGGSNFHVVLEEAEAHKSTIDWTGAPILLLASGNSVAALNDQLTTWAQAQAKGEWDEGAWLREAAAARARFVPGAAHRLHLAPPTMGQLQASFEKAQAHLATAQPTDVLSNGFSYGGPAMLDKRGKLAILFPGQGSQYPQMGRDLVCAFPVAFGAVQDAEAAFAGEGGLGDLLFPKKAYNAAGRQAQKEALADTTVAQPALGAIGLGMWRVLESYGVQADMMAGHSFGELVALCAAGRCSEAALHAMSNQRGQLMGAGDADRGTMLAVSAPLAQIDALLQTHTLDVVLANRNAPGQGVLSGSRDAIAVAQDLCQKAGWRTTALPVAAAFHSPLVEDARAPFAAFLESQTWQPATLPVFANTTGAVYPGDEAEARQLLAQQLTSPVRFVSQVEAMYKAGARTFVEVGPKTVLTGLCGKILSEQPHQTLALDASRGRKHGLIDVAGTLGSLAILGFDCALEAWHPAPTEPPKQRMSVPLVGANYRQERKSSSPPAQRNTPPMSTRKPSNGGPPHPQGPAPVQPVLPHQSAPPMQAAPALGHDPGRAHFYQQSLMLVQEGIRSMQALQHETSASHQRFLDGQQQAQFALREMLHQSQRLFETGLGLPGQAGAVMQAPQPLPPMQPYAAQPTYATPQAYAPPAQPQWQAAPPAPVAAPAWMAQPAAHAAAPMAPAAAPVWTPQPAAPVAYQAPVSQPVPAAPVPVVPAPVMSAQTAAPAPNANGAASPAQLTEIMLDVVSELTGYPKDMLSLEMDMEADLGIDSIKRVEILSAVTERLPQFASSQTDHLGSLRTLQEIVDALFASQSSGAAAGPGEGAAAPVPFDRAEAAVARRLLALVPLHEAHRPLSFAPGHSIWVTDDGTGHAKMLVKALAQTTCEAVLTPAITATDEAWSGFAESVSGVPLAGVVVLGPKTSAQPVWDAAEEDALCRAFWLAHIAAPKLEAASGDTFFVTVSRMDGGFGLLDPSAIAPLQGGLAGLTKTLQREIPKVSCRAIDMAAEWPSSAADVGMLAKLCTSRGALEVGLSNDGVRTLAMNDDLPGVGEVALQPGEAVVITGGARGVTAAVAQVLAAAHQPALYLFGRSPLPVGEPDWLAGVEKEAAIKKALLAHHFQSRPTPKALEQAYQKLQKNREIQATLDQIRATGANATYMAVDVRSAAAVEAAIAEIRREAGPVRMLIHAAGVIEDKRIAEKSVDSFQKVMGTKVEGLRHLLNAMADDPLHTIVLFSSVSGRTGNVGQVDYAMANEVLNKVARQQAALRDDCRVLSLNWGPWDGGMVTPALKRMFAAKGVSLIGLQAGADAMLSALGDHAGEAVEIILGSVFEEEAPVIVAPPVTAPAAPTSEILAPLQAQEPEMAEIISFAVSESNHPVLSAHRLAGRAVVPLALSAEWLALGARHGHPGLPLRGFDNMRVLRGISVEQTPTALTLFAGEALAENGGFTVPVELREAGPQGLLSVRGQVLLGDVGTANTSFETPVKLASQAYPLDVAACYEQVLFHGPPLQGIRKIEGHSVLGIEAIVSPAPRPKEWIEQPLRRKWSFDPLLLDSAFQLAILWCHEHCGMRSLPSFVRSLRLHQPLTGAPLRCTLTVEETSAHKMKGSFHFSDAAGLLVAELHGYECTMDAALAAAFQSQGVSAGTLTASGQTA